jgi:hypothetical protein
MTAVNPSGPPISAALRSPRLGPVRGHEEPFKMGRRTVTTRDHQALGRPRRVHVVMREFVLRLREPNLRTGGLPNHGLNAQIGRYPRR